MKIPLWIILLILFDIPSAALRSANAAPPIYACYVTHIEKSENIQGLEDYRDDRGALLGLAEAITSNGSAYDFQSDWTFLSEVGTYDTGQALPNTDGKNLIRYFHENLGVSVDPHCHENQYNIADIAYMIEELGVTPPGVVGGFIYAPAEDSTWERFSQPIPGRQFPSYSWTGTILWGGATLLHTGNDDRSSGIWHPYSKSYFYRNNPGGPLTQIGGGLGDYEGLLELLARQEAGMLSEGRMYTASIFLWQSKSCNPITQFSVQSEIRSLRTYVDSGRLIWATLPEMADIWHDQYGGEPSQYRFWRMPPVSSSDYDGDGTADIGIFREGIGLWAIRGITRCYFGAENDSPASGDYNGDGTTDIGIFRESSGLWALRGVTRFYFGTDSDQPVPGDYSGAGTMDAGIFREGSGLWALRGLSRVYWGGYNDLPLLGDCPGAGTATPAIFRSSKGLWAIRGSTRLYFGAENDYPLPGDFNGDRVQEAAIFRPSSGLWAVRGVTRAYFGSPADQPVPADFTGGGGEKIGIFRGSSGLWAARGVTRLYFGTAGDIPVTR
ncbi:MAG: hypothetical protein U9N73_00100 [Candidatus Auribacterota bacterium]|nr:hypothetical protein [Candidatus Auribacterota bacterium]